MAGEATSDEQTGVAASEGEAGPGAGRSAWWRRWWVEAVAVLLLAVHAGLAGTAILNKSLTSDEIAHQVGGASYWLLNDYRLQPENGNLPQRLIGLPLVLSGYTFPDVEKVPGWRESDVWEVGYEYVFDSGNDADEMVFRSRMPILAVSLLLGVGVFVWSRSLWGPLGGLASLTLYVFCPTILANGALATSDVTAAGTMLLSIAAGWAMLHRLTWGTLWLTALAVGLAAVSKTSSVLLAPVLLGLAAYRVVERPPLQVSIGPLHRGPVVGRLQRVGWFAGAVVVVLAATVLTVWAFYGFRYSTFAVAGANAEFYRDPITLNAGVLQPVLEFAKRHHLLPEAFCYGTAHAISFAQMRQAFLNGEYSLTGWWYYFPFTFAVKTPIPTLVTLLLAAVAFARRSDRRSLLRRMLPLLAFILVYAGVAITSNLNIGHRHLIPLYPPLYIMAGAVVYWGVAELRAIRAVVAALLITLAAEAAITWPHYLAYFNLFVGGPENGYRHLVDSSLDWGQDLPGLKRYLDIRGLQDQAEVPVYLSYFGTSSPTYYGIQAERLPSYMPRDPVMLEPEKPLRPGIYCISATTLQNIYLPTMGQWSEAWEQSYWDLRRRMDDIRRIRQDPGEWREFVETVGHERVRMVLYEYEHLRFGRLTRKLLEREPDGHVGYSILIYNVSAKELAAALDGPPAELYASRQVKGGSE